MTSLASTKGPSMTLSLPSAILTRAPVCSGINPPLSTRRPALISRSEIFWTAASSSGEGPVIGCGEVTIYMKRIGKLLLGRGRKTGPLQSGPLSRPARTQDDDPASVGSTRILKKFWAAAEAGSDRLARLLVSLLPPAL